MFSYVSKSLCLLLLLTSSLYATPPTITVPEKVYGETCKPIWLTVQTDGKGVKVVPLDKGLSTLDSLKLKDPNELGFFASKAGSYRVLIYTGNADGPSEPKITTVIIGGPDVDPSPNPTPVPPVPPEPVKSFYVIFIWESEDTLTPAQKSVMNGLKMEQFLLSKTTTHEGAKGWRTKDKDASTTNDTTVMNKLWSEIKPEAQRSSLPCVAVVVNNKVDILPLEATQDAMIAKLNSYLGGK